MKKITREKFFESIKPYLALIVLTIVFAIGTGGQSLSIKNIKIVTEQSLALMLASTGVFFVMTTGMMDLSISGVVCVCCFILAKVGTINPVLGLVLMVVTGVVLGLFNGVITSVLKVPSFLATLCTAYICTGLMTHFIASSAAMVPVSLYSYNTLEFKLPLIVILLVLVGILYYLKPFGHYVRMIGSNETSAHFSAIKVTKIKVLCFVLNGALASVAAFFIGIRAGTAALSTGSDLMFNVMVALTLGGFPFGGGGKAKLSAPIIGSITTYVLSNGMLLMGVSSTAMSLIKGSLFLGIVFLTSPTCHRLIDRIHPRKIVKAAES